MRKSERALLTRMAANDDRMHRRFLSPIERDAVRRCLRKRWVARAWSGHYYWLTRQGHAALAAKSEEE